MAYAKGDVICRRKDCDCPFLIGEVTDTYEGVGGLTYQVRLMFLHPGTHAYWYDADVVLVAPQGEPCPESQEECIAVTQEWGFAEEGMSL